MAPVLFQAGVQFAIACPHGVAACHHDQVYRRQIIAMNSEAFAYESFDTVAPGRVPDAFLGQRKPEACMVALIVPVQNDEPTIGGTAAAREHGIELRPREQPVRALESGSAHRIRR